MMAFFAEAMSAFRLPGGRKRHRSRLRWRRYPRH